MLDDLLGALVASVELSAPDGKRRDHDGEAAPRRITGTQIFLASLSLLLAGLAFLSYPQPGWVLFAAGAALAGGMLLHTVYRRSRARKTPESDIGQGDPEEKG